MRGNRHSDNQQHCAYGGNQAAHGDADIGLLERRRVVHTVADHAYRQPLRLIRADIVQLILRQAVGPHLVDVQLRRNGSRGVFHGRR